MPSSLTIDGPVASAPYHGPPLFEKTLVSFVRLKDLNLTGGSVVTFTTNNSDYLNGLVLGEVNGIYSLSAVNTYWSVVSEENVRLEYLRPGYKEEHTHTLLKMATTFKNVNGKCQISIYRNGDQIGQFTKGQLKTLAPGNSKVMFGMREMHDKIRSYPPSYQTWIKADIEEIRSLDFAK